MLLYTFCCKKKLTIYQFMIWTVDNISQEQSLQFRKTGAKFPEKKQESMTNFQQNQAKTMDLNNLSQLRFCPFLPLDKNTSKSKSKAEYRVSWQKSTQNDITASIAISRHISSSSILSNIALPCVTQVPLPKRLVHLFCGHPFQRIHANQPLDHMSALLGDILVDVLELPFAYFLEQIVLLLGAEGVVSLQDDEKEDSETPEISVDGYMIFFGDDFRSHVGGGAAEGVDGARWHRFQTKSKIDKLKLFVAIKQYIFSLDVSMHYIALVQIFKRLCDSFEYLFGLGLLKSMLWFGQKIVVEGVGAAVLLDQVDFCCALDGVYQFGDDWMVESSENIDLSLKIAQFVGFIQSFLFVDFDCYFLVVASVQAHLHHPICSLSQLFIDLIVFQLLLAFHLELDLQKLSLGYRFHLLTLLPSFSGLFVLSHFFLFLLFHLLYLKFAHIIRRKLLLHEVVYQNLVLDFGPLFFFLQGLFSSFGV